MGFFGSGFFTITLIFTDNNWKLFDRW